MELLAENEARKKTMHLIERIARFHLEFEGIHPFIGGRPFFILIFKRKEIHMELNEIEKSCSFRWRAAEGLMAKLRVLSNAECMDLVKDIQKNYRLPYPARTIGEKFVAKAISESFHRVIYRVNRIMLWLEK